MEDNCVATDESRPTLLIITHESVGDKMAGPSVRAWEMAQALGGRGLDVMLATPFPSARTAPNVSIVRYAWDTPASLEAHLDVADVVMAIGPVMTRVINAIGHPIEKPTLIDTYYVPEIEQILLNVTLNHEGLDPTSVYVNEMITYLCQGDFFLCANTRHFDLWIGALLAAERLNMRTLADFTVDKLIGLVPLGLPATPPQRGASNVIKGVIPGIGLTDKVIYWGGGIWDWTDPLTLLEAMRQVLQQRDDVRILFGALHHYDHTVVPTMSMARQLLEAIEREGWLNTRVFFLDWIPYDQRSHYLLEADIGISMTLRTIENRYAIRARSLDYLWTTLPCILTAGDDLADVLHETGLATLVQPGDTSAVAVAILRILADDTAREALRPKTEAAAAQFHWPAVVQAAFEFASHPYRAADAEAARARIGTLVQSRASWDVLLREKAVLIQEKFDLQAKFTEERMHLQSAINQLQTNMNHLQGEYDKVHTHLQQVENGKIMRAMNATQQGLNKILGRN